jgi:transaldolase
MIKVPATSEGLPAIETLIAEGINVNATLIFSLEHYEGVAEAYIRGLQQNPSPDQVASVASFFISRLDSVVDKRLGEIGSEDALRLQGKAAIANATVAYARFQELFSAARFTELKAKGAKVQRPLWASTSTKDPSYSDVLYVEELIGPDTVNTLPTATLEAFRDHGTPRASLIPAIANAPTVLEQIAGFELDLDDITQKLQDDGVDAFSASFDAMMGVIKATRDKRVGT